MTADGSRGHVRWICALLAIFAFALANASAERGAEALSPQVSAKDKRVALVIGNGAYQRTPLKNPVNDARAMAHALREVGFDVLLRENVSQQEFIAVVREFGELLKNRGGVGLFYYAGHGVQLKGLNYLIPVDATAENEDELRYRAIDANQILEKMAEANNPLNLVILDACRDNPFPRSFRSQQRGLAQMDAPTGTIIAFATAPGAVAYDGTGDNGVYTKYLLRNLTTPGLPIEMVLKRVREQVSKETNQKQIPWESSSLLGEFFFKPAAPGGSALTQADNAAVEVAFWESVKNSNAAAEYRAYLEAYPKGQFVALARSRLDALMGQAPAPDRKSPSDSASASLTQPSSIAPRPTEMVHVGDAYTYQLQFDGWSERKIDTLTVTVTDVQGDSIQEQLTLDGFRDFKTLRKFKAGFDPKLGFQETELPGRYFLTEFSPYLGIADIPAPGKEWNGIEATLWFGNSTKDRGKTNMVVRSLKEERIKVPAGEFAAIRVEAEGQWREPRYFTYKTLRLIYWYSPALRRTVKMTRKLVSYDSPKEESFVLTGVQLKGGGR